MVCVVIGSLLLATCLVRWTTERVVSVDDVAFWAVVAAVTVAWELRRGSLGLGRSLAVALVAGLAAVLLSRWLGGDGALFTLPLWVAPACSFPDCRTPSPMRGAGRAPHPASTRTCPSVMRLSDCRLVVPDMGG
ncbi:hypothetical protein ACR6C2_17405 [Streptomyces sp. INA 01156]